MLSHYFSIIIERGIIEPGHDRELVDGINAIYKWFLLQIMTTAQLPGAKRHDTKMVIHTGTSTFDVCLAR